MSRVYRFDYNLKITSLAEISKCKYVWAKRANTGNHLNHKINILIVHDIISLKLFIFYCQPKIGSTGKLLFEFGIGREMSGNPVENE